MANLLNVLRMFNSTSPDLTNAFPIKGTRVGIEKILYDFLYRSRSPEEIVASYPSLTLEQVYATITYYLHNRETVMAYLANWLETTQRRWEEQNQDPPPAILKLRRRS
jgi:uncharacterized protein (DUF433 family)